MKTPTTKAHGDKVYIAATCKACHGTRKCQGRLCLTCDKNLDAILDSNSDEASKLVSGLIANFNQKSWEHFLDKIIKYRIKKRNDFKTHQDGVRNKVRSLQMQLERS